MTMRFQGVDDYPGFKDTLLHCTLGAVIAGSNAEKSGDLTLFSRGKSHAFVIHVLTLHPATEAQWLQAIKAKIAAYQRLIECVVSGGRIKKLELTPASRLKDIIIAESYL